MAYFQMDSQWPDVVGGGGTWGEKLLYNGDRPIPGTISGLGYDPSLSAGSPFQRSDPAARGKALSAVLAPQDDIADAITDMEAIIRNTEDAARAAPHVAISALDTMTRARDALLDALDDAQLVESEFLAGEIEAQGSGFTAPYSPPSPWPATASRLTSRAESIARRAISAADPQRMTGLFQRVQADVDAYERGEAQAEAARARRISEEESRRFQEEEARRKAIERAEERESMAIEREEQRRLREEEIAASRAESERQFQLQRIQIEEQRAAREAERAFALEQMRLQMEQAALTPQVMQPAVPTQVDIYGAPAFDPYAMAPPQIPLYAETIAPALPSVPPPPSAGPYTPVASQLQFTPFVPGAEMFGMRGMGQPIPDYSKATTPELEGELEWNKRQAIVGSTRQIREQARAKIQLIRAELTLRRAQQQVPEEKGFLSSLSTFVSSLAEPGTKIAQAFTGRVPPPEPEGPGIGSIVLGVAVIGGGAYLLSKWLKKKR